MSDLTALGMDVVTEKSNHNVIGMMPSVCITPAAPSPLPLPYPITGTSGEGIGDGPMRTKMCGVNGATIGSIFKACHGNEPGTLKEVVSLNTGGPCPPTTGAFTVLCELGPMAFTGSMCDMNKAPLPGMASTGSDAGGAGGGGGGGGGGAGAGGSPGGPSAGSNSGGDGGGSSSGASASPGKAGAGYCPDSPKNKTAPGMQAKLKDRDSHNLGKQGANISNATADGKAAALQAIGGAPGSAGTSKGQAFYSGSGRAAATAGGYAIQEDSGGAKALETNPVASGPGAWSKPDTPGSNITGENLWKTISQRSAENANGTVQAFVVGQGGPRGNPSTNPHAWDTVFSTTELPTLLQNPNCKQIDFTDPDTGKPAGSWTKGSPTPDCPSGAWSGPTIPSTPKTPSKYNPTGATCPGFSLHPTEGFTRP
jgi:hypothetical protein